MLEEFSPQAIHLATEGPVCLAARRWCLQRDLPFTTAYHTQFPDYVAARTGVNRPNGCGATSAGSMRPAQSILASTPSIARDAEGARPDPAAPLGPRGRSGDVRSRSRRASRDAARCRGPVQLYVGRVAVEKNIEAFLTASHPGTKVVVGDGPALAPPQGAASPTPTSSARKFGADLAAAYAAADVFVFPSRTDTFGLVMIEALACGTPVAAYPVTGPIDVLTPRNGRDGRRSRRRDRRRADARPRGLRRLWPALHLGGQRAPVPRTRWSRCAPMRGGLPA